MPIIVLFNGKKRSGKDFIANYTKKILEKSNKKVEIIHFADSLKEVLCTTFNISLKELDNLKNSNTIIFNSLTMRNILQRFGTDAMQNIFWKSVWVDLVKDKIKKSKADYILISDFRFKHEFINNSITVKIITKNCTKDSHISEHDLDNFNFDFEIINEGNPVNNLELSNFIQFLIQI